MGQEASVKAALGRIPLALVLLAAVAAADAGRAADELLAPGEAAVDAAASGLFLVAGDGPLEWSLVAEDLAVERHSANYTRVGYPGRANAFSYYDPSSDVLRFGAGEAASAGARPGGALLALARGDAARATGTQGALRVSAVDDPAFDQGGPVVSGDDSTTYTIHERVGGAHLRLASASGRVELRGDLVLQLSGVDYRIEAEGGSFDGRTGSRDVASALVARQGHVERHVLTARGAVLVVSAPDGVEVVAKQARVAAPGLALDGVEAGALLDLAPRDGRLVAWGAAPSQTSGGAAVPAAVASGAPWILGALALAGLAAGAILVARRRRRPATLEEALLAMEERRWSDALASLSRLLEEKPRDPTLLLDRAVCLEALGRLREARQACEGALRVAPDHAEVRYYLARILARQGELTLCLTHLARALAADARLRDLARADQGFRRARGTAGFSRLVG